MSGEPRRVLLVNTLRAAGGGEKWVVRMSGCWRQLGIEPILLCNPNTPLQHMASDAGIEVHPTMLRHDLSPVGVWNILAALRRHRPRVVVCCNERAFRLAAPAAAPTGSLPLVYRNGLTGTFKNRSHNRLLIRRLSMMVANTTAIRDELSCFGWLPPDKIRVIENGVDLKLFGADRTQTARIRSELGADTSTLVYAVLGRLEREKGQWEAIDAFAQVRQTYPDSQLWLAGQGPGSDSLAEEISSQGLGQSVKLLGYRTDVAELLGAVDVLLQPSHREGLGNTLLEAMASRKPVIASAVGGSPTLLEHGAAGLLVPPRDVSALTQAMLQLASRPELRLEYGARGRRVVEARHRLEHEADQWLSLFRELCGARW